MVSRPGLLLISHGGHHSLNRTFSSVGNLLHMCVQQKAPLCLHPLGLYISRVARYRTNQALLAFDITAWSTLLDCNFSPHLMSG